MPNRYKRDSAGNIVPKSLTTVGGIENSIVVNADLANSTIQSGKISFFKSTEQTGTGSEQTVAHGLARTPALVLVIPSAVASGTDTFVTGTADGTNVKATVATGAKYYFLAL